MFLIGLCSRRLCGILIVFGMILLQATPGAARTSSIVVDYSSGRILQASAPDEKRYPASLTKMMTLYLVFDALKRGKVTLTTPLKVTSFAAGMPASRLGLRSGDTISVRDAILAVVTRSANDAAVVIAENLAGSEIRFATMMTGTAVRIGMRNTTFRNASGLPNAGQMTTARDMAILASRMIRDFPTDYRYFSQREFVYKGRVIRSHNRLLIRYRGADGLKTGYIRAAGYNLTSSAIRDGKRVVAVVMGGRSPRARDDHMIRLLDQGFARLGPRGTDRPALVASATPQPDAGPVATTMKPKLAKKMRPSGKPLPEIKVASLDVSEIGGGTVVTPKGKAKVIKRAPSVGKYGLQVGAFRDSASAQATATKAAKKVPSILLVDGAKARSVKGDDRLYRARVTGLERADAEQACRRLRKMRQECFVVRLG